MEASLGFIVCSRPAEYILSETLSQKLNQTNSVEKGPVWILRGDGSYSFGPVTSQLLTHPCPQQPQQARPTNIQRAHHQTRGLQPGATGRPQPPSRAKHTSPLQRQRGSDRAAQGQVSRPPSGAGEVPRPDAQHEERAVPRETV